MANNAVRVSQAWKTKQEIERSARLLVREAGYAAQKIEAVGERGEMYSVIMSLYDQACDNLRLVQPDGASEFIKATYGPALRFTTALEVK